MNNVLVTGGAGYIGSHQVQELLNKGYKVVVIDNLSTGFEKLIDKRAKFYNGDLRDLEFVKDVLRNEKIDSVIHFAARSLVGESMTKPLEYFDNNVYGMQVLLQAMNEENVKNIVFSSTAAVYGIPDTDLIDEENEKNPINPYGESKLMMEKMVKWAQEAYGINYVVLRYFNVAGASLDSSVGELHDPETHLIPIVLQVVFNKREVLDVYGNDYNTFDGTCIRDYIHVLDLVNAHVLALEYLQNNNKSNTFNLGYGHGFSVLEIIDACQRVTKQDINYRISPRRIGDPDILVASNKKAINELKWIAKYDDIDKIIETAYNFYKNNN